MESVLCSVRSLGLTGMNCYEVTAECFITNGLPGFDIVGLPDLAVKESRERVRAAIKNSGVKFPTSRITLNLAPAGMRKEGTLYDLPILVGILAAKGEIEPPAADMAFLGELSLSGQVRPVNGVLPMALAAARFGIRRLFVPAENAREATLAEGVEVYPVASVRELLPALRGERRIDPEPRWEPTETAPDAPDFKDVKGQYHAKRALEIAAAGSHNILLVGPPGSGKSMLAKRLPSILPDLTRDEALEITQIHSIMGKLSKEHPLVTQRPFRSPHHTISAPGLAGGGSVPHPGEISLAHKGVLFLDELPEFNKDTLEVMRQPLEDGVVTISRVNGTYTYPSRFMLVCAMNPCKCGWYGDASGRCTCSQRAVDAYMGRISGPLLDRIDMIVEVPALPFDDLRSRGEAEPSCEIRKRVNAARERQKARFGAGGANAGMGPAELRTYCRLGEDSTTLLRQAFDTLNLTARSYDRILRVARTIADLAGEEEIGTLHIAEAIQYRSYQIGRN